MVIELKWNKKAEGAIAQILDKKYPESLKDSVERDNRRQELQKQITALQQKVRKEKQLNKQVQLNTELKKLKKELEDL